MPLLGHRSVKGAAGGEHSMRNGILVLLCAVVGDVPSGGDLLVLELVRRWPENAGPVRLVTSPAGKRRAAEVGLNYAQLELLRAHHRRVELSATRAYILRTLEAPRTVWRASRNGHSKLRPRFAFSASPFLPDLAAAITARLSGLEWIQSWQLAIPPPWVGYENAHSIRKRSKRVSLRSAASRIGPALSYASQQATLAAARRWCKTLLVPTRLMAAEAVQRGFSEKQIYVTELGVDFARIKGILATDEIIEPEYDAVFLGRFHSQKGLEDLPAIWKHVLQLRPNARLAIIGDGQGAVAARFKAELASLPEKSTYQLGVLTGADKYLALARAKLLLFPSHYESWGHVVIEGMAAGLPVVGYDLKSSRQTFGDTIVMVPVADTARFAAAIHSLLGDRNAYKEYQRRGIEFAQKHDWDRIAEAFFERILGGS